MTPTHCERTVAPPPPALVTRIVDAALAREGAWRGQGDERHVVFRCPVPAHTHPLPVAILAPDILRWWCPCCRGKGSVEHLGTLLGVRFAGYRG